MVRKAAMILGLTLHAGAWAAWEVKSVTDPMTDRSRGIASVRGDAGILIVKCDGDDGRLYVEVRSDGYLGAKQIDNLSFRVDGGEIISTKAVYFGRSAIVTLSGVKPNASDIIGSLMGGSNLAVQMSAYGGSSVIVFDISGSRDAILQARDICYGQAAKP